ncbi:hypothetical protein [Mucilaginibacter dorajii]|uniref:Uncharacterized protein n=1 Tax=Mucilaginibacter dorajii TaxID=692994 RepID=A0ABP7QZT3_9SPHI|nr:hypothetical protein [Mucilaginibacter dorajii]MCS3732344.1 hypothetical protein [Mucilaginibacter dorajii]
MSNLSNKTERKALKALSKTLRFFDELRDLDMTACDDYDASSAQILIHGILQANGYMAVHEPGKGTRLMKQADYDRWLNTKKQQHENELL